VEKNWMLVSWQMLLARGAVAVVFGIVAIAWPISTAITLVVLWGVWALMDGVSSLVQAMRPGPGIARALLALSGVVALGAAFLAILRPVSAAVALTWIVGIWLIARGVLGLILASSASSSALRWFTVAGAGLDLLLGALFAANPGRSAVGISAVLGIIALLWGLVFLVLALMLRKEVMPLEAPPPATA
jgi:uncharacterized membrane protein HdeD (DUF308 family)